MKREKNILHPLAPFAAGQTALCNLPTLYGSSSPAQTPSPVLPGSIPSSTVQSSRPPFGTAMLETRRFDLEIVTLVTLKPLYPYAWSSSYLVAPPKTSLATRRRSPDLDGSRTTASTRN